MSMADAVTEQSHFRKLSGDDVLSIRNTSSHQWSIRKSWHGEFNADDMALRRVGSTSICSSGLLAHAYQSRHQPIYAPMQINARKLLSKYGDKFFNTEHKKEAGPSDHLLIVQLCANDPSQLLTSMAAIQDLRMLSI